MFVYPDTSKMQWIIYRPDLHNLQTRRKKFKRVVSGYKGIFCQCKNQKYLHNLLSTETPQKAINNEGLELHFLLMQEC